MNPTNKILHYHLHDVAPYINWIYYFHAWGFEPRFAVIADIHGCDVCRASWLTSFAQEDIPKATEAMQLFKETNRMLDLLDRDYEVRSAYKLCEAYGDGDNLIIDGQTIPLLRQQTVQQKDKPNLCLSDFVRPLSSGQPDTVGVFCTCIESEVELLYEKDPYKRMMVQVLADRLAEAATEKMHEYVRKETWGYAKDEHLSMPDLMLEKFQGIRPAVGYPSLPDQSVNFLLNKIIDMSRIGISLTESGAMHPHASVSGLMFAHPSARYFSVGKIASDQLRDYAKRKGVNEEEVRKFLVNNII